MVMKIMYLKYVLYIKVFDISSSFFLTFEFPLIAKYLSIYLLQLPTCKLCGEKHLCTEGFKENICLSWAWWSEYLWSSFFKNVCFWVLRTTFCSTVFRPYSSLLICLEGFCVGEGKHLASDLQPGTRNCLEHYSIFKTICKYHASLPATD